jgi:hypothetical protein
MLEKLVAHLREKALDKKPTVDEIKAIEGFEEVNATLRDEAWKTYQAEQKKESDAAAAEKNQTENDTTSTTATTADQATHRVMVKRDGFRRCGRAWQGIEEVRLTAEELETLEADEMFVVTEL